MASQLNDLTPRQACPDALTSAQPPHGPHRSRHIVSTNKGDFDPRRFLANVGEGHQVLSFAKTQTIFTQGDAADSVFYIQEGNIRLSVVSNSGKEATLGILNAGDFFRRG
jgi:CRP/FNR family transcriptional regulator, cyclic AMP receptor protein